MSQTDRYERILASLHDAAFDDARWPAAAGLIDDACGAKGNILAFGDGRAQEDAQLFLVRFCFRGVRRADWEREYLEDYWPRDERVPRLRRMPVGRLVPAGDLYTAEEKRTSAAYNEALPRSGTRDGLNVRLDGPGGSRIVWTVADPVEPGGWRSARIDAIRRLLPHVRQFVRVR